MKKGYLVISRKIGERIFIYDEKGSEIEILLSDIDRGKADIAIRAPKEIKITRMVTHMEEQKESNGNIIKN